MYIKIYTICIYVCLLEKHKQEYHKLQLMDVVI